MGGRLFIFFFFFQAEDGIRDPLVTGVQTCALPISAKTRRAARRPGRWLVASITRWPATPPATAENRTYARGSARIRPVTAAPASQTTGPTSQPQSSKKSSSSASPRIANGIATTTACTTSAFQNSRAFKERILDSSAGRLAQLVERLPYKQEVARSSRAPPISAGPLLKRNVGHRSNGRAGREWCWRRSLASRRRKSGRVSRALREAGSASELHSERGWQVRTSLGVRPGPRQRR